MPLCQNLFKLLDSFMYLLRCRHILFYLSQNKNSNFARFRYKKCKEHKLRVFLLYSFKIKGIGWILLTKTYFFILYVYTCVYQCIYKLVNVLDIGIPLRLFIMRNLKTFIVKRLKIIITNTRSVTISLNFRKVGKNRTQ